MPVLADVSAKARLQVASFVAELLLKRLPKDKAVKLATILSEGRWTHDFPITVPLARELGLPVSIDMPPEIYRFMNFFPQPTRTHGSVEYIPIPHPGQQKQGKT